MTFADITRTMLGSMDFFELRRTAARYYVPFQGVRRQKLIRDLERKIVSKAIPTPLNGSSSVVAAKTLAARSPEGAVSAKPSLAAARRPLGTTRINTFSARNSIARVEQRR